MSGEFMETLDGATRLARGILFLIGFSIYFVMTAGPYILYRNVVNAVTRATTKSRVWIIEENHAIYSEMMPSPFPMIDGHGTNCPVPKFYACVGSVREAEDWLLGHGYKKTTICTRHLGESEAEKEFFVRHVPGTKAYSYVMLMIDYGDYDIRLVPYHYPRGKSPVNFARFQEEDWSGTGGWENTPMWNWQPPMPCMSTDACGSHTFGRMTSSNWDEINEYPWDRYVEAVMGKEGR
ncbi:MAG: hypothetical protein ABSG86_22880 [Thermoguttaceae bacterium]|jgi:hypothetical protein